LHKICSSGVEISPDYKIKKWFCRKISSIPKTLMKAIRLLKFAVITLAG